MMVRTKPISQSETPFFFIPYVSSAIEAGKLNTSPMVVVRDGFAINLD